MSREARAQLFEYLEANATLEELASAANSIKQRKAHTAALLRDMGINLLASDLKDVKEDARKPIAAPKAEAEVYDKPEDPSEAKTDRKDISPGKPSIVKIGSATTEQIMRSLRDSKQPAAAFTEHCKLLWSRHQIKFDGHEYYL